ncbi:MAG: hypothetical protein A2086_13125 [Spirochaetes bacterium GWD1_27_9]|nr:MAG: hypothetical protein A2Z98_03750 [Spirochaetes bacterium GWB1_27_13]OHD26816.1 MAG: hypothetical protein A2Y34_18100 [Spirochaetes bacterium GWC1_27_15]OHD43603.1 MAG: hypothetical protein A2086_13125 [Spirochaetes bacterium GWD1_27_9]
MKNKIVFLLIIILSFSCSIPQNRNTVANKITYPNKNELWKTGSQYDIKWNTEQFNDGFDIYLYLDKNPISLLASNVKNNGICNIKIPKSLDDNLYKVKFSQLDSNNAVIVIAESENIKIVNKFNWLVMFYGCADNNLEQYIYNDINEIEASERTGKGIKTVALIDRSYNYTIIDNDWSDTRAYEIGYDTNGFNKILSNSSLRISVSDLSIDKDSQVELNMGDEKTLAGFVSYCYNNYSASKYMLIIANHGSGFRNDDIQKNIIGDINKAVAYDESDGNASLNMKELREGLSLGLNGKKLDILAFDACDMGMLEIAYEMKDLASIMVSSSYKVPTYGYPYFNIFNKLNSLTEELTPQKVSSIIVEEFYNGYTGKKIIENSYYSTEDITISAVDLTKIKNVSLAVNKLAGEIINNRNSGDQRYNCLYYSFKEYVDIGDFASKTIDLYTTSQELKIAIGESVLSYKNGKNFIGFTGLSIFFPVHASYIYDTLKISDYNENELLFAKDTPQWVNLINSGIVLIGTDSKEFTQGEKNSVKGYGNDAGFDAYYNPNDKLNENTEIQSFIYYANDEDWYFIDESTYFEITLTSPSTISYTAELYKVYSVTDKKIELLPVAIGANKVDNLTVPQEDLNLPDGYLLKITGKGSFSTTEKYSLMYKRL